jgi:hypothetical protein
MQRSDIDPPASEAGFEQGFSTVSRKPWSTPQVILSEMRGLEAGPVVVTDIPPSSFGTS